MILLANAQITNPPENGGERGMHMWKIAIAIAVGLCYFFAWAFCRAADEDKDDWGKK